MVIIEPLWRELTEEEIQQIFELEAFFPETLREPIEEIVDNSQNPDTLYIVCRDYNVIVGYVLVIKGKDVAEEFSSEGLPIPCDKDGECYYIDRLIMKPEFRKQYIEVILCMIKEVYCKKRITRYSTFIIDNGLNVAVKRIFRDTLKKSEIIHIPKYSMDFEYMELDAQGTKFLAGYPG